MKFNIAELQTSSALSIPWYVYIQHSVKADTIRYVCLQFFGLLLNALDDTFPVYCKRTKCWQRGELERDFQQVRQRNLLRNLTHGYDPVCSVIIGSTDFVDGASGDRSRGLGDAPPRLNRVRCRWLCGSAIIPDHFFRSQLFNPITSMEWTIEPISRAA